jgi:hypothetical protein
MKSTLAFRWIIIVAALSCVVGLLILPQVDPPDFVVGPSASYAAGATHVGADFLLAVEILPDMVSRIFPTNFNGALREILILQHSDTQFVLTQICTRRW